MTYEISDVAQDLKDIGESRRLVGMEVFTHHCVNEDSCGEHAQWLVDGVYLCEGCRPHTASRMEPTDALDYSDRLQFSDLVRALEEALLVDGDKERAMDVLTQARQQMDVDAFAERQLKDGAYRG